MEILRLKYTLWSRLLVSKILGNKPFTSPITLPKDWLGALMALDWSGSRIGSCTGLNIWKDLTQHTLKHVDVNFHFLVWMLKIKNKYQQPCEIKKLRLDPYYEATFWSRKILTNHLQCSSPITLPNESFALAQLNNHLWRSLCILKNLTHPSLHFYTFFYFFFIFI